VLHVYTAKVNNSKPCFDNSHLLSVESATKRTLVAEDDYA